MQKLYRQESGEVVAYHEAWVADSVVVEHWGEIGTAGQTREHPRDPSLGDDEAVRRVLQDPLQEGFSEIDEEDHAVLMIEYEIAGLGSKEDLQLRHELQSRMDETLGWRGLGHCDGGSMGSGTMEVCCFVVDVDRARAVIEKDLAETKFGHFRRIYDEGAD